MGRVFLGGFWSKRRFQAWEGIGLPNTGNLAADVIVEKSGCPLPG